MTGVAQKDAREVALIEESGTVCDFGKRRVSTRQRRGCPVDASPPKVFADARAEVPSEDIREVDRMHVRFGSKLPD
jgi:hypothetical protein